MKFTKIKVGNKVHYTSGAFTIKKHTYWDKSCEWRIFNNGVLVATTDTLNEAKAVINLK